KEIGKSHWDLLRQLPITVIGLDYTNDLGKFLEEYGEQHPIQGNFLPELMSMPVDEMLNQVEMVVKNIKKIPLKSRQGWICGLGHGILPDAKEDTVRAFVKYIREEFA